MPPTLSFYPFSGPPIQTERELQSFCPELQAPSADVVLHVCDEPIKAAGDWYVRCRGCGWTSEPQASLQAASSILCGVEEAAIEGQRWAYRLRVKLTEDLEFDRMFPKLAKQVGRR